MYLLDQGHRVAVLAVEPVVDPHRRIDSRDKTRMARLAAHRTPTFGRRRRRALWVV